MRSLFHLAATGMLAALLFSTASLQAATLEEIIVTAKKREESLQDINIAVTALTSERLEDGMIGDIEDLQTIAPNVSAGNDFAQAKFFFRGIGLSTSFTAVDPSVALYTDGAIIARAEGQLGAFFDLERIEVLRGPQGALYGRNATGGSLNLISRKPSEEIEGYGRVTYGNYDLLQFEGGLGGPIIDNVLGRVAFKSTDRDGYGENEASGEDVDDANKQAVRGHLQFNFNESADLLLSAEYTNEDDHGLPLSYVRNTFGGASAGDGGFPKSRRNAASEAELLNDRDSWSVTATLNWRINDNWAFKSISNYRDLDILWVFDNDHSANINDDVVHLGLVSQHFSEELQLSYDSDRLRGLVGFYYFNEDIDLDEYGGCESPVDGVLNLACQGGNGNGSVDFVFAGIGRQDIEAAAVFAHATYDLTGQISLNAGARYSYEMRESDNIVRFQFPAFNFFAFINGKSFTEPANYRGSFNDFSPSVGIEWTPMEDMLLYATYSQAFKSGAILIGFGTNFVQPEEIENLELGLKTTLLNEALRLNVAGFVYEGKNMQFDRSIPQPGGTFSNEFGNATGLDGHGLELEATWLLTEQFTLSGFASWLDSTFSSGFIADDQTVLGTEIENLGGRRPRKSPEWNYHIRGEYDFSLADGSRLVFGAEASYKSKQYFTEFNRDDFSQGSYTFVDVNLKYISAGERFSINVWGKNITDETVRSSMFPVASTRVTAEALLPPATVGVTIGYTL